MRDLILDAVSGREFELAVRYCGLQERTRDREHHQPCPFCAGKDRFWFSAQAKRFYCRQCGFWGNIIDLLIVTNGITYWKALETLASETGILLPKWEKKTPRAPTRAIWKENKNDDRMTMAMLVLNHLRFVLATDEIDFQAASMETLREHASRLVDHTFDEIVTLMAIGKYAGDRQKAHIALECLYFGKDLKTELGNYNIDKAIREIRMFGAKERWKLEKEIQNELERI